MFIIDFTSINDVLPGVNIKCIKIQQDPIRSKLNLITYLLLKHRNINLKLNMHHCLSLKD